MEHNLIVSQPGQLAKYKKPGLLVLADAPKLREIPEEEKNAKTVKLIIYLLNLLGVTKVKTEQHNALAVHISENYADSTFEEIHKAFNLFVKGEFETKPYQQLNAVVFGKVMSEYDELKRNQSKTYQLQLQEFKRKSEPMSQEEIDGFMELSILKAIETFAKTGVIEVPGNKYDWLDSKGRLQGEATDEDWKSYKKTKYSYCKARLIAKFKNKETISIEEIIKKRDVIKELEEAKSGKVVLMSKTEILEDYFKELLNPKT